jgi:excisionase family DNA binding protein
VNGPLLTPLEAAELLRLPRSTLYELCRRGVLPHLRLGRHIRFERDSLERFVRQQLDEGRTS